jgi:hypothetical protein
VRLVGAAAVAICGDGVVRCQPGPRENRATRAVDVCVIGWRATTPAEEVNVFFLSDSVSPILFLKLSLTGAAIRSMLTNGVERVVAREEKSDIGEQPIAPS